MEYCSVVVLRSTMKGIESRLLWSRAGWDVGKGNSVGVWSNSVGLCIPVHNGYYGVYSCSIVLCPLLLILTLYILCISTTTTTVYILSVLRIFYTHYPVLHNTGERQPHHRRHCPTGTTPPSFLHFNLTSSFLLLLLSSLFLLPLFFIISFFFSFCDFLSIAS